MPKGMKKEVSKKPAKYNSYEHLTDEQLEELDDKFYYDRSIQPESMDYEWKRYSCLGQEDRTHQAKMMRHGWVPVPSSRHPETAGEGAGEEPIIIEGLMLMERPIAVSERARQKVLSTTNQDRKDHFERLKLATPKSAMKFSRSYEAQPIPE